MTEQMGSNPQNPYLPAIIEEIKSSHIYPRFLQLLKDYCIESIYDCHAHISSGREDTIGESPSELTPQFSFTIDDVNHLYGQLFETEGIAFNSVVFDTPLPVYDLAKKNSILLSGLKAMSLDEPERVVPFAVVTPGMNVEQIQSWVDSGAKGFKMTPRMASTSVKRGVISDISLPEMLNPEALIIANANGMPLVVHLPQLVVSPRMKQTLKDELVEIALQYPDIKIILAHLGQAQTPAKMDDMLNLIERNDLYESVWMDISAVTIPSVIAMALESKVKLLFGTDIDFALVERGRYIMFKVQNGQRVLAQDDDNGSVITALVSQNFGQKLKPFALGAGVILDAPLLLFQFEGIVDAVEKLKQKGMRKPDIKLALEQLFFKNAESLLLS